jgi:hypothetical protein
MQWRPVKSKRPSAQRCSLICYRPEMTSKVSRVWLFPILSLAVGLGYTLLFRARFVPFLGLLMDSTEANSFLACGVPALLAGIFGFLRPKPKEIWSYGLLMWAPQAIFGIAGAMSQGWLAGFGVVIVVSSSLAAVVGVLASYTGFALHKVVNRIRADAEAPPHIFGK